MRTTTLLVCLSLLGLAAAAPTASAASVGEPRIDPGPCSHTGTSLLAQVLDSTYTIKCEAVEVVHAGATFTVYVVNVVLDAAGQILAPVINAAYLICEAAVGSICYVVFSAIDNILQVTISPPDVTVPHYNIQ